MVNNNKFMRALSARVHDRDANINTITLERRKNSPGTWTIIIRRAREEVIIYKMRVYGMNYAEE